MKLKSILFMAVSAVVFTSCLKSKSDIAGTLNDGGSIVTEIADVSYNHYYGEDQVIAFQPTPVTETVTFFTLRSSYPRDAKPSGDIKVKLTTAGTAPAGAVLLPAGAFTFPAEVSVPRGTGKLEVPVTVNKTSLNPANTYGITFTIVEVSDGVISDLGKTIDVYVTIKNKYDGVYEITGSCVDANGLYTGDYGDPAFPREYEMVTTGPNSVLFFDLSWNYPNYIVVSIATGGGANTGIRPLFTFDPATNNLATAINNANGQALTVVPGSKFNPANRSWDIHWILGRWDVTEHFKFLHER